MISSVEPIAIRFNGFYTNIMIKAAAEPSLHARILSDIEGQILSGHWPPGYRIPFEVDLAAHYGCSRMTVNKALTQLAKTGLIERRRKSGSYVTQPHAQSAVLEIRDIRQEVQSLGVPYTYELLARKSHRATPADRKRLDVPADSQILDIASRHFAGALPFCFEERLINLTAVPDAATANFTDIAPGPWLLDQVPWSAAEHTIRSVSADRAVAAALDLPVGTACLVVERRTWSGGDYVTHVRLTYPGDRHALVAHFAPTHPK